MVKRQLVHLEVASDQNFTCGGTNENSKCVWNRVGNRNELAIEGTNRLAVSFFDNMKIFGRKSVLTKLGLYES